MQTEAGLRLNAPLSDSEPSKLDGEAEANVIWCTIEVSLKVPVSLRWDVTATNNRSRTEPLSVLVMASWPLSASDKSVTIWRFPSCVAEGEFMEVVAESTSKDMVGKSHRGAARLIKFYTNEVAIVLPGTASACRQGVAYVTS